MEGQMKEKEIQEGIELFQLDTDQSSAKEMSFEDIFTAYRNFSAYKAEPTIYSNNTTLPKNTREHRC